MTALATIADQSDVTLWPTWVLIVTAIPIIAAVVSVLSLVFRPHGVPVMGDELSRLDLADRHQCGINHCTYPGIVLRLSAADLGLESTWVCVGHSDEGDARRWWSA